MDNHLHEDGARIARTTCGHPTANFCGGAGRYSTFRADRKDRLVKTVLGIANRCWSRGVEHGKWGKACETRDWLETG
jgi:hypothetical protein